MSISKEKQAPLVSVAVVTYNQKKFLKECIESILIQDYPNIEIIVADDASQDGTKEMLLDYQTRYPNKFKIFIAEKNQGITSNSNAAHKLCSGKYVAWLGGDDLMLSGKISKQVSFMESNPDCTITYHNLDVFDSVTDKTLYYFNNKLKYEGSVTASILHGTFNGACSTMVRRERAPVEGYDKRVLVASDWLYWIECLANGGSINYIDEVLGRYRRHANNVTSPSALVSQAEVDHLLTCFIVIQRYPQYFTYALKALGRCVLGLRKKLDYADILIVSLRLRFRLSVFAALILHYLTFKKVRL